MKKIAFCLLIAFGLTACGVKGPLYFPEKQESQDTISGQKNA